MRRKDREVTDKKAIEAFIAKEQILRIAFYDNGDIYLIPVNYGYTYEKEKYTFYFHGAKAGRKYEMILVRGRTRLLEPSIVWIKGKLDKSNFIRKREASRKLDKEVPHPEYILRLRLHSF